MNENLINSLQNSMAAEAPRRAVPEEDTNSLGTCFICDKNPSYKLRNKRPICNFCDEIITEPIKAEAKPGRNDLCPCGSGLKYKKCCSKNEQSH